MVEYEAENVVVRESLARVQGEMNLFRGNMETILEILQPHRDPASAAVNVTHSAGVTIPTAVAGTTVDTLTEPVVPNSGNRHMVPVDSVRLAAAYPWGMPPHLATSLASGGAFFPHSALFAAAAAGFTWALPTFQTTLVDAADPDNNQGQIPDDLPNDVEDYRGPRLHFQIPNQTAQDASANQVSAFPFGYPGATSMPMLTHPAPQHVQTGTPQAPMLRLECNILNRLMLLKLCHRVSPTHLRCGSL